jgi:hypothetical protein
VRFRVSEEPVYSSSDPPTPGLTAIKGKGRMRTFALRSAADTFPSLQVEAALNPQPSTLKPQPSTLNPQPSTLNLNPQA